MTLSLPLMNNLCKRWNLPTPIREACDLYFLRRISDPEFVSLLIQGEEPGQVFIREFGVAFEVVFLNDSLRVYTKNGEKEQRSEPNDTFYWLSFRSITFDFQGTKCTKSYVLVQVDRPRIREELSRAGAVGAPRVPFSGKKADILIWEDISPADTPDTVEKFNQEYLCKPFAPVEMKNYLVQTGILWQQTYGVDHYAPWAVFEKIGLDRCVKEHPIKKPTHFTGLTSFIEKSQPPEKPDSES